MTIEELKEESSELKEDINSLLKQFSKKTGLKINYMTVDPVLTGGKNNINYVVNLDIRL